MKNRKQTRDRLIGIYKDDKRNKNHRIDIYKDVIILTYKRDIDNKPYRLRVWKKISGKAYVNNAYKTELELLAAISEIKNSRQQ